MQQDYTISGLCKTFSEHALMQEEHAKFSVEQYKINFPDQEVPQHMLNDFSISKALCVMACEIEKIKHSLGIKENN